MPTNLVVLVAEVLGVLGTLAGVARVAWKVYRRIEASCKLLEATAASVKRVEHELDLNGGGTVKDLLDTVTRQLAMERALRRHVAPGAVFDVAVTDGRYHDAHVSEEYVRLTGMAGEHVTSYNWLTSVHDDDRPRVERMAQAAVTRESMFVARYRLVNRATGAARQVEHRSYPVRVRETGPVIGWVGVITPVADVSNPSAYDALGAPGYGSTEDA